MRNYYRTSKLQTLKRLAGIYDKQNNKKQAEAKYKEAAEFAEKTFRAESVTTAMASSDLADFYFENDKPELAKNFYEQSSRVAELKIKPLGDSEKLPSGYLSFFEVYIHSQQRLGKIGEKKNGTFYKSYYENALTAMDNFRAILSSIKITSSSTYRLIGSGKYHDIKLLTADYYKDRAEILESLVKLSNGAEASEKQKLAREARQMELELRAKESVPKKNDEPQCKDKQ